MKNSRMLFCTSKILLIVTMLMLMAVAACTKYPEAQKYDLSASEKKDFDRMWNFADPAGSEAEFRRILPEAIDLGDVGYHAELLTQIARAEGMQGKYEDAEATLKKVESMLTPALKREKVRYLLERGRLYNMSGDNDRAVLTLNDAFNAARECGEDYYAVDAATIIGKIKIDDKTMSWDVKALEISEASRNSEVQSWRGNLYNKIGWSFFGSREYEKALDIFRRNQSWQESRGEADQIRLAKYAVGRTLRMMKNIEEAYRIMYALYQELEAAGTKDGYVCEELGEIMMVNDNTDGAKDFFACAWNELSKNPELQQTQAERLARMKKLAGL